MSFDPTDQKNQKILDYFKSKKVLIVDPQKSVRTNLKRILCSLGVISSNIFIAERIVEAKEVINQRHPHYVFACVTLNDGYGLELVPLHKEKLPNRFDSAFILISDHNDYVASNAILEHGVDNYISQPFTIDRLTNSIVEVVHLKHPPTPYQIEMAKSQILYNRGQYDEALQCLNNAEKMSTSPIECHYERGKIYLSLGDMQKAKDFFEKGLAFRLENYHCLMGLIEIHAKNEEYETAFDLLVTLLENFPISFSHFPLFIEISLKSKNFHNLFELNKVFDKVNDDEVRPEYKQALTLGLIEAAVSFLDANNLDDAVLAATKAIEGSYGNLEILKKAIPILVRSNRFEDVKAIIKRYSDEHHNKLDFQIIQLETQAATNDDAQTLTKAMELIRKSVKSERVYEIAIQIAKKMGRKKDFIEDLAFQASQEIPEKSEQFKRLIGN